ncbi:Acetamidase [Lachnellula occidentalis]|uniref:Acetamidase n=1 Tax=Lachnellula occidentalis TaxID=215460 RepID=A0A8H8RK36_9HELO|nr:Acetamidase [Lachnellula occidentalis]
MDSQNRSWHSRAAEKRESILNSIPGRWIITGMIPSVQEQPDVTRPFIRHFLSSLEIEITETDAVGIVAKTSIGDWSAVEVTEAFCHRASVAHQLVWIYAEETLFRNTKCLHEAFFDAALSDAKLLDDHLATFETPLGPLHVLPVSLKDQFHIKSVDTTMGYVGWINTFQGNKDDARKGTLESELVRELRALGAILYCKTSVPHTLMSGETSNNIIGYTYNPKNRNLTAGGSSGGEGALIGLKGSPGGFGSEIGGSIRILAAFNGLYRLRPSAGRIPYEGTANSMDRQCSLLSVLGPLATTARSVRLLFGSVLSQEPWLHDPLIVELPWR